MRLAILHYHLRPGGVTTVIEHSVSGLAAASEVEIVVLTCENYLGEKLANVQIVPELGYHEDKNVGSPESLAASLETAARRRFGGELPDVWHCHNHSLGKNVHLPDALGILIHRGNRFLLEIHDFAEDGRPNQFEVFSKGTISYPIVPAVHYGAINTRDRDFLIEAGLPRSQVHDLPDPVLLSAPRSSVAKIDRPVVLYPTRGIRRKNLGEAVLLAALCEKRHGSFFATTRGPDNATWQPIHDEWVAYALERQLPITFGVVGDQSPSDLGLSAETSDSFDAWLGVADCVLTTSVAEGFGLAYLESLAGGHPLLGRDLPEITADFKEQGLVFPGLYRAVRVPIAWIGEDRLLGELHSGLAAFYDTYSQPLPEEAAEDAFDSMVDGRGRVDFGRLHESFQREIVDHIIDEGAHDEVIFETDAAFAGAELWLDSWFREGMSSIPMLTEQRRVMKRSYSVEAFTERLLGCYTELMNEPATGADAALDSNVSRKLLSTFLSPERFQFLRS